MARVECGRSADGVATVRGSAGGCARACFGKRREPERVVISKVFGTGARHDLNRRRVAFRHLASVSFASDGQRAWFSPASSIDVVPEYRGQTQLELTR